MANGLHGFIDSTGAVVDAGSFDAEAPGYGCAPDSRPRWVLSFASFQVLWLAGSPAEVPAYFAAVTAYCRANGGIVRQHRVGRFTYPA